MNYPALLTPLAVALCVAAPALAQVQAAAVAYRNPALTVDERVADLLGRMTLEEKVGQLMMWDARSEDLSFINTRQPGSILHILGAKVGRAMDLAAQNRLGIPLLVGEDGIHGHSFWKGATIFPTQLGAGRELESRAARAGRARDRRGDGAHRHPLDVLARALPDAGPALGPHRRDLRRGPVPDRRARRRAHPRLPGQGPRRPDGRARHRQALRGLLRDAGRPRRLRGRHSRAASCAATSCRPSSAPRAPAR